MMAMSMARCGGCGKVKPTDELQGRWRHCNDCHNDIYDASGVGYDAVYEAEMDQREDDNR